MTSNDNVSVAPEVNNNFKNEGTQPLAEYTLLEVSNHCDLGSCWLAINDKVYDVTHFLNKHPGGMEIILEHAGTDSTVSFVEKGHSDDAKGLLSQYCIGKLVEKDSRVKQSGMS